MGPEAEQSIMQEDSFSLGQLWQEAGRLLRRHGLRMGVSGLMVGVLFALLTLTLVPRRWEARSTFYLGPLPMKAPAMVLQQVAEAAPTNPMAIGIIYNLLAVEVLRSRRFAEEAINRFKLLPVLREDRFQEGVRRFQKSHLNADLEQGGLMSVSVVLPGTPRVRSVADLTSGEAAQARDEQVRVLVAEVANYYVQMLSTYLKTTALDEANAYLQSTQKAFQQVKADLEKARSEWNAMIEQQGGIPALPETLKELTANVVSMERETAMAEVNVQQRLEALGPEHPELLNLLNRQKALQDSSQQALGQLRGSTRLQNIAQRKQLELTIAENVYVTLMQQLKQAEVEAEGRGLSVKLVDTAIPPDKKAGPSTIKNALLGMVLAWLLSLGQLVRAHRATTSGRKPAV